MPKHNSAVVMVVGRQTFVYTQQFLPPA